MEDTREVEANLLRKNSSSSSSSSIPLSVDTEEERNSDDVYVSEESSSRDPHYYLTHFMSSVSHVISSVDGHVIIKEKLDVLSSFKEADGTYLSPASLQLRLVYFCCGWDSGCGQIFMHVISCNSVM